MQKNYDDAEEFFLICAGSFPQGSKAPGALLELLNIYLLQNKENLAVKISQMIGQLYTDSPEYNEAKKKISGITINGDLPEIELLNLNENQEIKTRAMSRLIEDMDLSIDIKKTDSIKNINSGFYIQFGYYGNYDNALEMLKSCGDKNIKAFIAKVTSSTSKNIFYRVLSGPYDSGKTANEKLIDVKEKNMEAIVLELTKDYE